MFAFVFMSASVAHADSNVNPWKMDILNLPTANIITNNAPSTTTVVVSNTTAPVTTPVVTTTPATTTATVATPVASTTPVKHTTSKPKTTTVKSNSSTLKPLNTESSDTSDLTALSINGKQFMPNSILGWLLVIILILAIVITARRLTAKPAHEQALAH